ncbi:uncharacterized protein [Drosophila pseudoobscura]|uniref:Uncharacterized protein n=1 Tax=Drosophila pseudoobscura pseudoobscura TaxID=46245 RepID=A0A6I8V550_DROPS|nr:uncharacterized protein LOC6898930 [Drosophila pseudoobscura]
MSSDESPAGGDGGDGAGTGSAKGTTTAGAALMMASPWLTVAAATAYTTTAMWAKLREMGIFKSLRGRKSAAAAAAAAADDKDAAAAGNAAGDASQTNDEVLKLFQDGTAIDGLLLQDEELQEREEGLGPDRLLEMSPIDF